MGIDTFDSCQVVLCSQIFLNKELIKLNNFDIIFSLLL